MKILNKNNLIFLFTLLGVILLAGSLLFVILANLIKLLDVSEKDNISRLEKNVHAYFCEHQDVNSNIEATRSTSGNGKFARKIRENSENDF